MLEYYLLFCLTTAIYAHIRVYSVAIRKIELHDPTNVVLRYNLLGSLMIGTMVFICAPIFVITVFSEGTRWAAINGLYDGLK